MPAGYRPAQETSGACRDAKKGMPVFTLSIQKGIKLNFFFLSVTLAFSTSMDCEGLLTSVLQVFSIHVCEQ